MGGPHEAGIQKEEMKRRLHKKDDIFLKIKSCFGKDVRNGLLGTLQSDWLEFCLKMYRWNVSYISCTKGRDLRAHLCQKTLAHDCDRLTRCRLYHTIP